jgi:hypothetical protein
VNGRRRGLWSVLILLSVIVLVSFAIRLLVDLPNIVSGNVPGPDAFEHRYALHPVVAYLHIVPAVVFLLGAPFQLSRRFRAGHLRWHRLMGRILVPVGLVAGVMSVVVGVWFPYGGAIEATAAVVFGAYFTTALVKAFLAVRAGDITQHRRWMLRAVAVAVGVGTVRIWRGIFEGIGLLAIQDNAGTYWFGVAFWLAFVLHALAAEVSLAVRPAATGLAPA